jgi:predicted transcriptional regulator of viral defense system
MPTARIRTLEELFKAEGPILKSAALRSAKFCSKDIACLVKAGHLSPVKRGYYAWGPSGDTMDDMEVLVSLIPEGVISLFSAANYHDLSRIIPQTIEITLPTSMRTPIRWELKPFRPVTTP